MAAAKKPAETKKTYTVQWLLSYEGNDYEQGATLSLSENEAAPLLELGVIKLNEEQ